MWEPLSSASQGPAGSVNRTLTASAQLSLMKKCVRLDQLLETGGLQNTFGMQITFAGPTEILKCVNI